MRWLAALLTLSLVLVGCPEDKKDSSPGTPPTTGSVRGGPDWQPGLSEFLVVEFDGAPREVVIDGLESGFETGEVITLRRGRYTLRLAGEGDYSPSSVEVDVEDSLPGRPLTVSFRQGE